MRGGDSGVKAPPLPLPSPLSSLSSCLWRGVPVVALVYILLRVRILVDNGAVVRVCR
jgi:hypothetical protein